MLVTFLANSRVLNYMPGFIYTVELTPLLRAVLEQDKHLSLIDPPELTEGAEYPRIPWFSPDTSTPTAKIEMPVKSKKDKELEAVQESSN